MINREEKPALIKPKKDVKKFLRGQIKKGNNFINLLKNSIHYEEVKKNAKNWCSLNSGYLEQCFNTSKIRRNYEDDSAAAHFDIAYNNCDELNKEKKLIEAKISWLECIIEKIDNGIYEETEETNSSVKKTGHHNTDDVFIVHGHQHDVKNAAESFIRKLGLQSIILDEKENEGYTIIEKFEKHAEQAGFAIVLLTPDDIGYSKNDEANKKPRARQNVILELGYFLGKLGRKRVCAIYCGEVEIPSDYQGVLWISYSNGWERRIAHEMHSAGLNVDLNTMA